ncbi:MAG TPA: type II toxin-antitoxin system VapC family toxin [Caulobacteraceae bacterium]
MNLLLDTHVALWAIADARRLPPAISELIADPANEVSVSAVTIWEIAIKHALARGGAEDMPVSGRHALRYFQQAGYSLLGVSAEHAAMVEDLPRLHGDPFDRLLVAQAASQPLRLITHDPAVAANSDAIIAF